MRKQSRPVTIKQLNKMFENGKLSFEHPIQRRGEQWSLMQKSLMIHSVTNDFPIPALYSIVEDGVTYILDGKQRLTSLFDFVNEKYILHEDTPEAHIDMCDSTWPLAEMRFDEMHEEVQDAILSTTLLLYKIEEATHGEIEEMFFRLNNGTPLSKQQKAKAKLGRVWIDQINALLEHPMLEDVAHFTHSQIKNADDETAIFQTMMLLDTHEWQTISSSEVFDYIQTFDGTNHQKETIKNQLLDVFDYINTAFDKKEKTLLKKVNFPMTVLAAKTAYDENISAEDFQAWASEFKKALKEKSDIPTNYKEYAGQGSTKKHKVNGRVEEMQSHLKQYFKDKSFADTDLITGLNHLNAQKIS